MNIMNSRSVKFALCALSMHYIAFMVCLYEPFHKFETAESTSRFAKPLAPLTISVVSDAKIERHFQLTKPVALPLVSVQREMTPILSTNQNEEMALDKGIITEKPFEEIKLGEGASEKYFSRAELTRMPTPVVEIDLNIPELKELSVVGQVDLTILIEANGVVSDVLSLTKSDELRAFSEIVIERFKNTRFMPGEINGRAVRAQLQITVVSEDILTGNKYPPDLSPN